MSDAPLQQSIIPVVLLTREHGAAGDEVDHLQEGMAPRFLLQESMTGAMAGRESGKGTDFEDILHVVLHLRDSALYTAWLGNSTSGYRADTKIAQDWRCPVIKAAAPDSLVLGLCTSIESAGDCQHNRV